MKFPQLFAALRKKRVKGRTNDVEGKIKELTGKVVGDKTLAVKGWLAR